MSFKWFLPALMAARQGAGTIPPCANSGTVSGSTAWVADVPSVHSANLNSLSFSGGKIQLTSNVVIGSTGSLSIWFKEATIAGKVLLGNTGNSSTQIQLGATPTLITVVDDAGHVASFTVATVTTSVWHNLIFVMNAGIAHLYVDGVESTSGGIALASTFTINQLGNFWDGSLSAFNWDGNLAEFRTFSSVLSATDISNINSGAAPVTSSDVHWKINEGSGTNIICYGS